MIRVAATAHRLPFRVRVLRSWWASGQWFGWWSPLNVPLSPIHEVLYVLVSAVAVPGAVLVHGELVSAEVAALSKRGYCVQYAIDLARARGRHLAVCVPA